MDYYLGVHWQFDCNAMHTGRYNTYTFVHDGKQRTRKPMTNDKIQSDVVLAVVGSKVCLEGGE